MSTKEIQQSWERLAWMNMEPLTKLKQKKRSIEEVETGEGDCPGFGQNRVNFHRNPGRGTAGGWGLTPPGQTEPRIPYHVTSRWVPVGDWRGGNALAAWAGAASVLLRESGCCTVRGCVFSLFVSFLFLFSLCLLFC